MLPTPSTSHVNTDRIYEPAEDSYLLLDTLSSAVETKFLSQHFKADSTICKAAGPPLVLEVGTGSGVLLAFVTAHARLLLGRSDVLAVGSDINYFACCASRETVRQANKEAGKQAANGNTAGSCGELLTILHGDLASPFRSGAVDLLIFNPPYVPTSQVPAPPRVIEGKEKDGSFEHDSHLLSLSYEGGKDGMEVTKKLLEQLPDVLNKDRGVAYILLCQQNGPEEVTASIRKWGKSWTVEVVARSGTKAGWEKLQVIRICRKSGSD
ncbi:MAG: hypothetical protein Q9217_006631 [Psora testacea]